MSTQKTKEPATAERLAETGMTSAEVRAFEAVAEAANWVLALPALHPMGREEMCHAFHQIQTALLARPGLRKLGWRDGE